MKSFGMHSLMVFIPKGWIYFPIFWNMNVCRLYGGGDACGNSRNLPNVGFSCGAYYQVKLLLVIIWAIHGPSQCFICKGT